MAPKSTPSKLISGPQKNELKGSVKKKLKGSFKLGRGNLALRRISDSSFNVGLLTDSKISTPKQDRNKRRLRANILTGANNSRSNR